MFLRQIVFGLFCFLSSFLLLLGNEAIAHPIISTADNEAMASLMLSKGKNKEALQYMNKAIAKDPSNAMLYSNRSTCYLRLKDLKKSTRGHKSSF